ncbi:MAG: adenine nucleotide alpha hydrolase [Pseudomonadota bacterium]
MNEIQQHLESLREYLASLGPVAVAVSGGVDSMTLAFVAHTVNPDSEMFHAISPAVPTQATDRVKRYAEREGWQLRLIDAGEIHDLDYLKNPANRCYFCKTNLYDTVVAHTSLRVVSGTNTDDLGDYRPGLIAADEHAVLHPYVAAGISKQMLRAIARLLGLDDLHDLPAAPCLSSRVTTGIAIDPLLLPLINDAEQALWQHLSSHLHLKGVRCRIRPDVLAIEIESDNQIDENAEYARTARDIVSDIFSRGGHARYAHQVVVEPYQRGSAFLIETLEVR